MPASKLLPLTASLLLLGGAPGCGSSDFSVLVTLGNVPTRAQSLTVSATLDQRPLDGTLGATSGSSLPLTLPLDQNRFGVTVPTAGRLAFDLQAFDSDGCTQGRAAPTLDVSTGYSTLDVSLTAQSPRRCGPRR